MKKCIFHIVLLCLVLSGCSVAPSVLPSGQYLDWMNDRSNGLVAEKKVGEFSITAGYRSADAMALMNTGFYPTPQQWKSAREQSGNMQYYFVTYRLNNSNQDILKYKLSDENEYFARSNYLSFGIEKDVYVLCGKDSLPCRLHQFTPHYGLSPKADLVFAFDEPDSLHARDRTLVIEDQLYGLGILQFEFKAKDLQNIPSIRF